jgi:hypothetical protein
MMCRETVRAASNEQMKWKYHLRAQVVDLEPKQRAHSPPKVPPISMAGGFAAGLASELKIEDIPYGRRFPVAYCGESSNYKFYFGIWCKFILDFHYSRLKSNIFFKSDFCRLQEG